MSGVKSSLIFKMKNFGPASYFHNVEIEKHNTGGLYVSQSGCWSKYSMEEFYMQNFKAVCASIDPSMVNELTSKLHATEQELAQMYVILYRKAFKSLLNPGKRALMGI